MSTTLDAEIRKLLGESKATVVSDELVETIEDIETDSVLDEEIDSLIERILDENATHADLFKYIKDSSLSHKKPSALRGMVDKIKKALKIKKAKNEDFVPVFEAYITEQEDEEILDEIIALDELSKKSLGSYIKKSSQSAATEVDKSARSGLGSATSDHSTASKHFLKAIKRLKGISKATDKLTKEQKEQIGSILEELEADTVEIKLDIQEDVNALLNGEDQLSEEFKTKAATIFEAAVLSRVKVAANELEEAFNVRVEAEVESIKEGLVNILDGYLNRMVEQWKQDNEIALVSGIKQEMFESFMVGIKSVFEENYVDIPEEKFDVLGSLEVKLTELERRLDESDKAKAELETKYNEVNRAMIVAEVSEGLTTVQEEKFITLVEEVAFEDEATFKAKLVTLREGYFKTKEKADVKTFATDEPIEEINETVTGPMAAYINALKKR